jgi:hypothetical protein
MQLMMRRLQQQRQCPTPLPLSPLMVGARQGVVRCYPSATGSSPPFPLHSIVSVNSSYATPSRSRPGGESTSFTPHVVRQAIPPHFKWSDAPVDALHIK